MSRFSLLKKLALTAVATTAAAVVVTVNPGAAQASSTVRLVPANSGMFLQIVGSSTDAIAGVQQWPFLLGGNQEWRFQSVGNNSEIVNVHSGKCVETDGVPGHQLFQAPCTGNPGELWKVYPHSAWVTTPGDMIMNPPSGLVMDVYGGSGQQGAIIDAWYDNGLVFSNDYIYASPNQRFSLYPV
jgi:hypothetical protein